MIRSTSVVSRVAHSQSTVILGRGFLVVNAQFHLRDRRCKVEAEIYRKSAYVGAPNWKVSHNWDVHVRGERLMRRIRTMRTLGTKRFESGVHARPRVRSRTASGPLAKSRGTSSPPVRSRGCSLPELTPIDIREIASGFQRSRVLLTAFELGIFTALSKEVGRSSAQIARKLGTDKRATDRLMNALCGMGFLQKRKERFFNTAHASRFLVQGKPEYMAGLMHTVHLWNTWSTLTRAVRRGTSVVTEHVDESFTKWRNAFIAAMHDRASKIAPAVVGMLNLSGVSRVLDVGGGSGDYSIAFALAKNGLRATVFDLPDIIPLTKKYVRNEDLSRKGMDLARRIDFVSGDFTIDDLVSGSGGRFISTGRSRGGGRSGTRGPHGPNRVRSVSGAERQGYDLVFLSQIIHSNSVAENRSLMRKCVKALNPSGQVVVQDFIMNENRTGPAQAALFALNMLVGTVAGDTYTEAEVRSWMKGAGLKEIVRKDTEFGATLIVGRKMK